jgi:peptidoglycan/LPS O-acetylase OafA/YrhL
MDLTEAARPRNSTRLPALDGLRGLLAVVVLVHHLAAPFQINWFFVPSDIAVVGFFALSGFVLTRSWNGDFGSFLLRRFIRLWPVYALCLAVGYAIAGVYPVWTQFFWYPILTANSKPEIDPPIWSLTIEAWAMFFMPLFVWVAKGKTGRVLLGLAVTLAASLVYIKVFFALFFIAGAYASRWDFRNRFLESAIPQWLGQISYSLYLTHWLVFTLAARFFGPWGPLASMPVVMIVAWTIWRFVEAPSIRLSRRVITFRPHRSQPGRIEGLSLRRET